LLRRLTSIDDGAVLTIEELAAQLKRPLPHIKAAHQRLEGFRLIEPGQDKYAKRDGLRITKAGQMVLIAH
jgi:hypothetical protein